MDARQQKNNRRWILWSGCLVAGLLVLVGACNLLIDPYDICRLASVPGFNQNKPAAPRHVRVTKPALLRRYRFPALATGSSRVEIGIDPDHPGWDPRYRPVFNFGLGAAGIEEIAQRVEDMLDEQTVDQLVIGLDFFMFNAMLVNPLAAEGEPEVSRWRLLGSGPGEWLNALFTTDALRASIETVRKQDRVLDPGYLPDGQIDTTFNLHRVSRVGHRQSFQRVERQYFDSDYFPPPQRIYRFEDPKTGASTLAAFRRILDAARAHGVDLRLYISPEHARLLEVAVQSGLWPRFEDWKRKLVATVAAEAADRPGRQPFPLWDFSGYNSVTTESVPAAGDRQTQMRYYWEGSHFKSETGDLILDRLFAWQESGRAIPEDFGVPLADYNIEEFLLQTRCRQQEYRNAHPQEIDEIAALAATFPHLSP
jgi:hypothetical protein